MSELAQAFFWVFYFQRGALREHRVLRGEPHVSKRSFEGAPNASEVIPPRSLHSKSRYISIDFFVFDYGEKFIFYAVENKKSTSSSARSEPQVFKLPPLSSTSNSERMT
ncbi:MAG TPA: hypothetical protein DEA82_14695 [Flavobacteriaceae bacterium]|nr:hypothetical protein [Flavobacteriaceae bacterium]